MDTLNYNSRKSYRVEKPAKWFMSLPPYYQNRDTEKRVSKVMKILATKPLPTQLEVAVGKVTKPFGPHKIGDYMRLNGNTRTDVWCIKPNLIPTSNLDVKIYEVDCAEYARALYESFDSSDSVESSSDKVTGFLRERRYRANNDKIRKGSFKTALINACRHAHDENGNSLSSKENREKFNMLLDFYWEELVELDSFPLDELKSKYSGNMVTCFLLILKKYGINNERFYELFYNYKDSITTFNDATHCDGVNYVFNTVYPDNVKVWTQTGFSNSFLLISKILYCFDMFMKGEVMKKKSKLSDKKVMDNYFNYLK